MAESLEDCEFCLPSQFLTDDDILMDMKNSNSSSLKGAKDFFGSEAEYGKPLFPFELPYGFGSSFGGSADLSCPVESAIGSPETESDEEDFLAGLTRQMAHTTLEDDLWRNDLSLTTESKSRVLSCSPQSTLCTVGSGCGCSQGSSRGSPNAPGRIASPPTAWHLLYAAAGEVAMMRMNEERLSLNNHTRELLATLRKHSSLPAPVNNPNHDPALYSQQALPSYQKLQAFRFQQLRQQQMMKQRSSGVWRGQHSKGTGLYQLQQPPQMVHNRERNTGNRLLGLPASAWPPLQQAQQQPQHQRHGDSGGHSGFLVNPGAKKECAGTGVFLPRRVGAPTETRKKSGPPLSLVGFAFIWPFLSCFIDHSFTNFLEI
uniref:Uncharacterized protein MANES_09G099100 n=1 Tax=Rhizophora mucronata TaxID=61149 RepID=A0A2P2JCR0_RHIMU